MSKVMKHPRSGVKVRMYRHGFGDCFLLAFRGNKNKPRYMLIDCGLHHRVDNHRELVKETLNDIREACKGHIHVLVVTHEHTDHISGFQYGYKMFEDNKITVDKVWLSWAEDENNETAKMLKEKYSKDKQAVMIALNELNATNQSLAEGIERLPSFSDTLGLADGDKNTEEAMKLIKGLGELEFCNPEEKPKIIPDVNGVRVFVLGPPEDLKLIRMDEKSKEMYLRGMWIDRDLAFEAEVMDQYGEPSSEDANIKEMSYPFEESYRRKEESETVNQFFQNYYRSVGHEWRTIDKTWLDAAGELALKLESHRNNTSLALAIEIESSGKVLLFPGDAQVGNWLSWGELEWKIGKNKIKGKDLLSRTVLYKVGHHGSHNATLKEKGLELMTRSDLVAMIPVDQKFAKNQGKNDSQGKPKGWKMPYEKLLNSLKQKTKGRVLRIDLGVPGQADTTMTPIDWNEFEKNAKGSCDEYIEFTVEA